MCIHLLCFVFVCICCVLLSHFLPLSLFPVRGLGSSLGKSKAEPNPQSLLSTELAGIAHHISTVETCRCLLKKIENVPHLEEAELMKL